MDTDAKSLYNRLNSTGTVPAERQTLIDLLMARDLVESKDVTTRWVPTSHQLADCLTKLMKLPPVAHRFLHEQKYCLVPREEAQKSEDHLKNLRQGQRQRRKERMKKVKAGLSS